MKEVGKKKTENRDNTGGELGKEKPAALNKELVISKEEWGKAKEIQAKRGQDSLNFKIRRKDEENALERSFISVENPQDENKPSLYGLANKGQYLGKGAFGKVKLAVSEDGRFFAVKIQATVHDKVDDNQVEEDERIGYPTDDTSDDEDPDAYPQLSDDEEDPDAYPQLSEDEDDPYPYPQLSDYEDLEEEEPDEVEDTEKKIEALLGRDKGGFVADSPSRKNIKGEIIGDDEKIIKKYQVVDYLGISLLEVLEGKKNEQGKTLRQPMNLTQQQKFEIAKGLLGAVDDLHNRGIIHCDLHPGNVLINLESKPIGVSAIDFGLAKELKNGENEVKIGKEHLNPAIIAPEMLRKITSDDGAVKYKKGDHPYYSVASDTYALGLMLKNSLSIDTLAVNGMLNKNWDARSSISVVLVSMQPKPALSRAHTEAPASMQPKPEPVRSRSGAITHGLTKLKEMAKTAPGSLPVIEVDKENRDESQKKPVR